MARSSDQLRRLNKRFAAVSQAVRDAVRPALEKSADQLVAAALILYPRYLDPVTRLPCGPEVMVDRLGNGSTPPVNWLIRVRAIQGKLRRFMTLAAEFFHG